MASMNNRLNIEKLDGNIVQKHGGSKQVEFKQLGTGVETGVHGVSNDDTAVAQRWLEDKQPEEKTNTDSLVKEQEKEYQTGWKIKTEDTTMSTYLVRRSPSSAIGFKTPIDMLGFFGWLASIKQGMLEPVKVKCIFLGYRKCIVCNKALEVRWRYFKGTGSMQLLQGDEFDVEPQDDHTFEVEPHGNVDHVVGSQEVQTQDLIYYHPARDREQHSESTPGSLSGDCDVEKNGKWSCIYAVGSQEYQMVCTRLDKASADVGMLDKFDHGLQTYVHVFVDFDYAMAAYMTLIGAWKKEIWLKGLLAESGYELSLVAGIATGALVKGSSRSEVPAQVKGAAYRY
ncbi:hypothetical protein Tco_0601560 [Tanacetum coccineum]